MGDAVGAGLALRLCWKAFPAQTHLREWRDDLYRALQKAPQGSDENSPGHPGRGGGGAGADKK